MSEPAGPPPIEIGFKEYKNIPFKHSSNSKKFFLELEVPFWMIPYDILKDFAKTTNVNFTMPQWIIVIDKRCMNEIYLAC